MTEKRPAAARSAVIALLLLLPLAACEQASRSTPPRVAAPAASAAWHAYVDEYVTAYFVAHPDVGAWAGRHEFDGRLPDWSAAGIQREIARLHAERNRAASFPESSLDDAQRFERAYLVTRIDDDLFWLESMEWPFRSPAYYENGLVPDVYAARDYAPLPERLRAYTRYLKAIPVAAVRIRANMRLPLPRTYIDRAHILFGGLAAFYENDAPPVFAPVDDVELQAEFRLANAAAIRAMKDLDAWFAAQQPTATDAFAIGAEKFSAMLRATELVDVPLAQLQDVAGRDLARNLAALAEACGGYAAGQPIAECVAKMQANKEGGSPIPVARAQLAGLRAFIEQKGLVSIPAADPVDVAESPPYDRYNAARIRIPGPFETKLPAQYLIAPPDPGWSAAEREAYIPGKADLLFISVHEVWPGHFLQFLHAKRTRSPVARLFGSYTFGEGWAHYGEELMWEAGLGDGDPETHIGMLVNALLRNVRLVCALGMHTGTMTVAECERMFREQGFQNPASARQQALRGTLDPGYGNYTLGKLMIRKLRDDWTASRGGRAAWKSFHDTLLRYGSPPLPLVRRAMLGSDAAPPF
jgi:hypothetical protein